MTRYSATFEISDHVNTFAILDSRAETAARARGGLTYESNIDGGTATWIFEREEARDWFLHLAWGFDHRRPIHTENSN